MSTIKENIANNIAELRKMNHMTQQDLAEKLNYTDKAISKWERGESTPDVESLSAIAKMFNLTVFLICQLVKFTNNNFTA